MSNSDRRSASIKIYRGTPKTAKSPGKDLNEFFRVECPNSTVMESLINFYPTAEIKGETTFITKTLNIYFIEDDINETLRQNYACFKDGKLRFTCDPERLISTNLEGKTRECQGKDMGIGDECPNKCTRRATLFFYLRELVDNCGDYSLCSIDTGSIYEWFAIPERLKEWHKILGSIKTPLNALSTIDMIPFALTRERKKITKTYSGGQGKGDFYQLKITVDPLWYKNYSNFQKFLALPPEMRQYALSHSNGMALEGLAFAGMQTNNDYLLPESSTRQEVIEGELES